MDDSSQVDTVKQLVRAKISRFEFANIDTVLRFIFFYTNTNYIYSMFAEKEHDIINHFTKLQEKDFLFSENYRYAKERKYNWENFIYEEVKHYHLNTEYEDSYEFDEDDFKYFPKRVNPVGFLKSLRRDLPAFREFLNTDYCIVGKEAPELKKQLKAYYSYKFLFKFLGSFRKILWFYFSFFNMKPFNSGYLTFTDTINNNFHFSNFLLLSHVYLQLWEITEAEETWRYRYILQWIPDKFFLFFLIIPNSIYIYIFYLYFFNNLFFLFFFFFLILYL